MSAAQHHEPLERDGALTGVKLFLEMAVLALFLVTFVLQPFRIPSESMVPTLKVGDFLLVDKQSYAPGGVLDRMLLPPERVERGDLVVFRYPVDHSLQLVKRVVGMPGDRIRLRDGRVLVNGQALTEPYAFYSPSRPNGFRDDFPSMREADPNVDLAWWITLRQSIRGLDVIVPPDQYFVLGDNRNDSEDSRYWGFVPRAAMEGRPLIVYFSLRPLVDATEKDTAFARLREELRMAAKSVRVLR